MVSKCIHISLNYFKALMVSVYFLCIGGIFDIIILNKLNVIIMLLVLLLLVKLFWSNISTYIFQSRLFEFRNVLVSHFSIKSVRTKSVLTQTKVKDYQGKLVFEFALLILKNILCPCSFLVSLVYELWNYCNQS